MPAFTRGGRAWRVRRAVTSSASIWSKKISTPERVGPLSSRAPVFRGRSRQKCCGVIDGPVVEAACWYSGHVGDGRGDECRSIDCGRVRAQQHVRYRRRHHCQQLSPRRFGRELLEAQGPADRVGDDVDLFPLSERLRSRQHVFPASMSLVAERANGDGGDVTLVNGRSRRGSVKPAHNIPVLNLWAPPVPTVECERTGAQKSPPHS